MLDILNLLLIEIRLVTAACKNDFLCDYQTTEFPNVAFKVELEDD